ncbi:hypothetical protein LSUB1_G004160 [Lachnellula subtilissima]|uniref:Uncharacterized protein n=1 Tax=Lachnellula subtilissima TaxID=602034 RepID=A0A8H8U801_9HELO|nr:hypothetical protein LSUB1_G004160 [Lachnellula subtilissima]
MAFFAQISASLQGNAAAMDQWGQHQLGPALGSAAKAVGDFGKDKQLIISCDQRSNLEEFGKTKLSPVLVGTGAALDDFGKNKLGPALSEVAKAADHLGHHHLGPAVGGVSKSLNEFGKTKLGPAFGQHQLGAALDKLPGEFGKWIKEHPGQTALLATSVATIAAPRSVAAVVQSTVGNLAARGAIATLQSASAGGYGVAVVHDVLRVGAVALGAAGLISKDDGGKEDGENMDSGNKTDEEEGVEGKVLEQKQKDQDGAA